MKMKAIVRDKYGQPEVLKLKEIPKPTPKENELLVRVHATTVNRTDTAIVTGRPFVFRLFIGFPKPKRLIIGTDFAGQIEAVGSAVENFKVGDRVWGFNDEGLQSKAQYMTIDSRKEVLKMPKDTTYVKMAACAEGPHYALNFMNKFELNENTRVLLNGATGGIGSAALQMLKSKNIYVTAVCNTKNIDLIKKLGADKIYNYETEDFTRDTEKYDYILDAVGKSRFPLCKHLLVKGGIYVSSELGKGAENLYLPLVTLFKARKVKFPIPTNCRKSLLYMNELVTKGQFEPVIDRTYKMSEVKEAYKYVMTGEKTGNVILQID